MRGLSAGGVALLAIASAASCSKYALDRQMEALCKKDGGVKVYSTIMLSASEFGAADRPLARFGPLAKSAEDMLGPDYRYIFNREFIVGRGADPAKGEGSLSRFHEAIYRQSDGYLLGESTSYSRSGGDLFTFGFQPSQNYCPKPRVNFLKSIFVKGN